MFHLCRNQVVSLHQQNEWKHLWKSDILIKDSAFSLEISFFHKCFSHILLMQINYLVSQKKQWP